MFLLLLLSRRHCRFEKVICLFLRCKTREGNKKKLRRWIIFFLVFFVLRKISIVLSQFSDHPYPYGTYIFVHLLWLHLFENILLSQHTEKRSASCVLSINLNDTGVQCVDLILLRAYECMCVMSHNNFPFAPFCLLSSQQLIFDYFSLLSNMQSFNKSWTHQMNFYKASTATARIFCRFDRKESRRKKSFRQLAYVRFVTPSLYRLN